VTATLIAAQETSLLPQLRQDFPGWSIWLSGGGRPWATRRGKTVADWPQNCAGWAMTIDAGDLPSLRVELASQEGLGT